MKDFDMLKRLRSRIGERDKQLLAYDIMSVIKTDLDHRDKYTPIMEREYPETKTKVSMWNYIHN